MCCQITAVQEKALFFRAMLAIEDKLDDAMMIMGERKIIRAQYSVCP